MMIQMVLELDTSEIAWGPESRAQVSTLESPIVFLELKLKSQDLTELESRFAAESQLGRKSFRFAHEYRVAHVWRDHPDRMARRRMDRPRCRRRNRHAQVQRARHGPGSTSDHSATARRQAGGAESLVR